MICSGNGRQCCLRHEIDDKRQSNFQKSHDAIHDVHAHFVLVMSDDDERCQGKLRGGEVQCSKRIACAELAFCQRCADTHRQSARALAAATESAPAPPPVPVTVPATRARVSTINKSMIAELAKPVATVMAVVVPKVRAPSAPASSKHAGGSIRIDPVPHNCLADDLFARLSPKVEGALNAVVNFNADAGFTVAYVRFATADQASEAAAKLDDSEVCRDGELAQVTGDPATSMGSREPATAAEGLLPTVRVDALPRGVSPYQLRAALGGKGGGALYANVVSPKGSGGAGE
jgi:hypothetical protein